MAPELNNLLKQQHKFGAQNETLRSRSINGGTSKTDASDIAELEKSIRSILISAGKPCRVSEILNDYRTLFGKKFPVWELGYSNPVEVLRQLPDACHILDESHSDPLVKVKTTEKIVHIFNLVKKSKSKPKPLREVKVKVEQATRDIFVPFSVQDGIRRILFHRKSVKINELFNKLQSEFDLEYMKLDVPPEMLLRSLPHIIHFDASLVRSVNKIEKREIEIPEYLHFEDEYVTPSYRLSQSEIDIAVNINKLLEEKECLKVIDIPKLYACTFGKELNWFRYGFEDLWRFLRLLPGNFKLTKLGSQYFIMLPELKDLGGVDLREIDPNLFCGPDVYDKVLRKIKYLVLQVNKGINAKYLKSLYETMYFEKLVIKEDLTELLLDLEKFNLVEIEENGKTIILLPNDEPEIDVIPETEIEREGNEYPVYVVQPGERLPSLVFPVINAEKQLFCSACVTWVESPNDFHLRIVDMEGLWKEELYEAFEDMLQDMDEFYNDCPDDLEIPLSLLKIGLICAVCLSGFWQRAKILDIDSSLLVIRLLDEGRCEKVALEDLRFLLKEFADFPILTFKASLFNIKPANYEWSFSAVNTFVRLTSNVSTFPKVMSVVIVYRNDGVLEVVLSDTSGDDEMHVGDELVNQELAEYKITEENWGVFYM